MNNLRKRKFTQRSLIIAIPALLLMFIFCIIPSFNTFLMSFKSYSPVHGLSNSPFVGFKNYSDFFANPYFPKIIFNTLRISVISILISTIYVFLLTLCISNIKNKWVKIIVMAFTIIPALIPDPIFIKAIISIFKQILITPKLYIIAPILNEMFTVAPIVIVAGAFATMKKHSMKVVLFVTLSYIAIRVLYLFMPDFQFIYDSYNPFVYESSEILSSYMLKSSMMQNKFSFGAATYIIRVALQIMPTIIATIFLILIPKILLHNDNSINLKHSTFYYIIAILTLPMAVLCIMATGGKGNLFSMNTVYPSLIRGIIIALLSCVLFAILMISLGFGLANKNKIVLIFTSVFILLGENIVGQYLQIRTMGILNTMTSVIIANAISCSTFFGLMLYIAVPQNNDYTFKSFFKVSGGAIIALIGIAFAKFFGDTLYPTLYISSSKRFPIIPLLKQMNLSDGVIPFNTLAIVLIPVIIAIICITVGTFLHSRTSLTKLN